MLSVEPILERIFLTSGAGAVAGRAVVRVVVLVVVVLELARGARGTGGFRSGKVVVVEVLVEVAGLVARVRVVLLLAVVEGLEVVLGLVESVKVDYEKVTIKLSLIM